MGGIGRVGSPASEHLRPVRSWTLVLRRSDSNRDSKAVSHKVSREARAEAKAGKRARDAGARVAAKGGPREERALVTVAGAGLDGRHHLEEPRSSCACCRQK